MLLAGRDPFRRTRIHASRTASRDADCGPARAKCSSKDPACLAVAFRLGEGRFGAKRRRGSGGNAPQIERGGRLPFLCLAGPWQSEQSDRGGLGESSPRHNGVTSPFFCARHKKRETLLARLPKNQLLTVSIQDMFKVRTACFFQEQR